MEEQSSLHEWCEQEISNKNIKSGVGHSSHGPAERKRVTNTSSSSPSFNSPSSRKREINALFVSLVSCCSAVLFRNEQCVVMKVVF